MARAEEVGMTVKEFGSWAMGYYGPYPTGQQADVAEYLSSLSAPELDELKIQMRASCPSHIGQVNGYPPDIEGMERLLPQVRRAIKIRVNQQHEKELAARILPAPENQVTTINDMMKLDWSCVFREGLARKSRADSVRAAHA
jgi:hypothetical protein